MMTLKVYIIHGYLLDIIIFFMVLVGIVDVVGGFDESPIAIKGV